MKKVEVEKCFNKKPTGPLLTHLNTIRNSVCYQLDFLDYQMV